MHKAGIIGLGNIAHAYTKPEDPFPYSHAGGIRLCDRVEVAAAADLLPDRREEFNELWGPVRMYDDGETMLRNEELDIIAVCVRGPQHEEMTLAAIEAGPRVVFQEKPAGCSLREVDNVHAAATEKGAFVVMSHSRHWGPHVLRMVELIKNGLIGEVRTVVGYCGGTPLSFSIHETDMICQFAGYDPVSVAGDIETTSEDVPAGYEPEPVVRGALIRYASGVTGIHNGAKSSVGSFCVEVEGTEGRAFVPFYAEPRVWQGTGQDEQEIDLATLDMPPNASCFLVAYDQIADYLEGGPEPECGPDMYRPVNEIAFGVIESGLSGQTIPLPCAKRDRLIFANG